jgi:hypothetical protein
MPTPKGRAASPSRRLSPVKPWPSAQRLAPRLLRAGPAKRAETHDDISGAEWSSRAAREWRAIRRGYCSAITCWPTTERDVERTTSGVLVAPDRRLGAANGCAARRIAARILSGSGFLPVACRLPLAVSACRGHKVAFSARALLEPLRCPRALEWLAAPTPLTAVVDDVHWADSAFVELLGALLRRPPATAVVIVLGPGSALLRRPTGARRVSLPKVRPLIAEPPLFMLRRTEHTAMIGGRLRPVETAASNIFRGRSGG